MSSGESEIASFGPLLPLPVPRPAEGGLDMLTAEEVDRLARRLAMAPEVFVENYLVRSEPGDDNP